MLNIAEKMLDRAERCSEQKKNGWQSRKGVSIAEKCSEEPKSAQHRRKTTLQSSNVHIRGVLYLWATLEIIKVSYLIILGSFEIYVGTYKTRNGRDAPTELLSDIFQTEMHCYGLRDINTLPLHTVNTIK